GGVVAIHRRLVGKTLIGGEHTQVGRVLRDKKADGAWFVGTHMIGHMEQRPPHRCFVPFFARMIAVIVIIETPVPPAPSSTPSAQSYTEGTARESCYRRPVGP